MFEMKLVSERAAREAEKNIKSVKFGPKIDTLVDSLWKQATDAYFDGKYTAAVLVGGVCAEAAHRFYCKAKGVPSKRVRGKWEALIRYSVSQNMLPHQSVGAVLDLIRRDYRNPWIHLDINQITKKVPRSGMDKTLTAMIFSGQLALNCLWLTAVELSAFYGSYPVLGEPAIMLPRTP
jgi:hypothetical protein